MNYRRVHIENSKIFITVVTSKRRAILIDNIDLLRNSFKHVKKKIEFNIDAIVVLPDHIHMIIQPKDTNTYPEIIKQIKVDFSRNIDTTKIKDYEETESRKKKKEKDIWQRRYWEHTITNEKELNNCIDYIHFNPVKHGYVKQAKEWKYSTFLKYVRNGLYEENWCDFNLNNDLYE